jgi:RNA polymerase sigma factor (TIGR02999 family)
VRDGDTAAADELMPAVYAELHRIAQRHLRHERPGHTLQPTALVNEAYLRMFGDANPHFPDRAHFLAFASRVMRRVLVDHARMRGASKRRPPEYSVTIEVAGVDAQLLDLDRAMAALARGFPDEAEVVELHYFGGLTARETAEVRGRSVHVVQHQLRFAHAWLRRKLAASGQRSAGAPAAQ